MHMPMRMRCNFVIPPQGGGEASYSIGQISGWFYLAVRIGFVVDSGMAMVVVRDVSGMFTGREVAFTEVCADVL